MYTPLPQMTDSESEEEFRIHINNSELKKIHNMSQNLNSLNMSNAHHNLGDADNVAILNTHHRKSQPMSKMRKLIFISSIFGCIFTILLFVWIIPCKGSNLCPAKNERIYTHNWLRNYESIELKGVINVVPSVRRTQSKNLIFMYRKNSFLKSTEFSATSSKKNGIISLIGSSGAGKQYIFLFDVLEEFTKNGCNFVYFILHVTAVAWYSEFVNEPIEADCNLIDADSSGETDCLIVDSIGEVYCINPLSGFRIWHVNTETNVPKKLNFPLIVPDINHDGVQDLLIADTITTKMNQTYNVLKLISGATGNQIGQNYVVQKCTFIRRLHINAFLKISFNCIINDTDIRITKSLQEIYKSATHQSIDFPEKNIEIESNQHKFYGQRKDTLQQRNIYSVNGKQLIVENYGVCPELCNVTVMLLENNDNKG